MKSTAMKVGALARRTGISIRTLHYYDEIGLLSPSIRSEAQHRLYTGDDIARLQQIWSLRQIGFSLQEIQDCLERPDVSPRQVLGLHLARLRRQIEIQRGLCARLEKIAESLARMEEVSVEDFLETIEVITMLEKYITPEQRDEIAERGQQIGPDRIREVEAEWPALIAQVRDALDNGVDPASVPVRQLADRWSTLVREFTGGNPAIEQGLRRMYQQESSSGQPHMDPRMPEYMAYIGRAIAASTAAE